MKFHEWAQNESEIFFNTRREIMYLQVAMKCSIIIIIIIITFAEAGLHRHS